MNFVGYEYQKERVDDSAVGSRDTSESDDTS